MKRIWHRFKWPVLVLINALPFLLNSVFFSAGGMDDYLLFVPIFAGLTFLNFRNCKKVILYITFQVFILICIVCSGYIATYLHYHKIVGDFMTLLVGALIVLLESAICIIATAITAIVKGVKNKRMRAV